MPICKNEKIEINNLDDFVGESNKNEESEAEELLSSTQKDLAPLEIEIQPSKVVMKRVSLNGTVNDKKKSLRKKEGCHLKNTEKFMNCDHCKRKFYSEEKLQKHKDRLLRISKNKFDCDHCELKFSSIRKLTKHKENLENEWICHFCGMSFDYDRKLQSHLKRNHSLALTCIKCDLNFKSVYHLRKHKIAAHGEGVWKCTYCNHNNQQNSVEETKVSAVSKTMTAFASHIYKSVVRDEEERKIIEAMPRCEKCGFMRKFRLVTKCNCKFCNESFNARSKLWNHLNEAHGIPKPFACDHDCSYETTNVVHLFSHLFKEHKVDIGFRAPRKCPYCPFATIISSKLKTHMLTHSSLEDRFKCPIPGCIKTCASKNNLDKHVRNTHGTLSLECKHCNGVFASHEKLQKHTAIMHTNRVKNFKCAYCDHRTVQRSNCNVHIKGVHRGLPVKVIDLNLANACRK